MGGASRSLRPGLGAQRACGGKIEISGGGRCNFTNVHTAPENFISGNRDFARSALARHTPQDFIALVGRHRVAYHEKKLGQLFCDGSSRQIVDMLLAECAAAGVEVRTNCRVGAARKEASFAVETSQGRFESESLVIAAGGVGRAGLYLTAGSKGLCACCAGSRLFARNVAGPGASPAVNSYSPSRREKN